MGIFVSKRSSASSSPKTGDENVPRFASLYHSWMGYLEGTWQFIFCLMTLCMAFGHFVNSSTPVLLSFAVITFIVNLTLFWVNSRWYGATFTTRKYLNIEMDACLSVCYDTPNYDRILARDLKFHNDQWHFSFVTLAYFFIVLFFAIFLGLNGTATPSPDYNEYPAVYSAVDNHNHQIVKIVQGAVLVVGAIVAFLMLETHSCFMHSTFVSLNNDLVSGKFSQGLSTPSENGVSGYMGGSVLNRPFFGKPSTQ